jgi:hypothetical protein
MYSVQAACFFLRRNDMAQYLDCVCEAMRGTNEKMKIVVQVLYKICYTKAMGA